MVRAAWSNGSRSARLRRRPIHATSPRRQPIVLAVRHRAEPVDTFCRRCRQSIDRRALRGMGRPGPSVRGNVLAARMVCAARARLQQRPDRDGRARPRRGDVFQQRHSDVGRLRRHRAARRRPRRRRYRGDRRPRHLRLRGLEVRVAAPGSAHRRDSSHRVRGAAGPRADEPPPRACRTRGDRAVVRRPGHDAARSARPRRQRRDGLRRGAARRARSALPPAERPR